MAQYLHADVNNPQHQKLFSKLGSLYVSSIRDLLLMDWIMTDNLPFRLVDLVAFRRWAIYRNPGGSLPTRNMIASLLKNEYRRAIPHMKHMLQSSRGLMHFTFDGWTSRQNVSFWGMNAHFLDQDWVFRTIFLGLPPLRNHHNGNAMADEMAAVLQFFGVEDR
jgi:hypothetical protein